jgi:alpha-L-fucosidase 2
MIRLAIFLLLLYAPLLIFAESEISYLPDPSYNLQYTYIPDRWDRAFPLGNGMIGVLVWQHNGMLRLSINRADLWDLRPMADLDKYSYQWAYEHRLNADWDTVQRIADYPYDHEPGPTKLPGAAIEFDISKLGDVETATLSLASAICTIK